MWTQQQQQYPQYQQQLPPNKITLIIHFRDEEIPLIVYRGTSEQAIHENIRELTNLYRFKCSNAQQQPIILSSNLPNQYHVYIHDPTIVDNNEEESDEPTPEEQAEYFKGKIQQMIDPKSVLNVLKSMLIVLETPPPPQPANENDENKENKAEDGNDDEANPTTDTTAKTEEAADDEEPPAATEESNEKKEETEDTNTEEEQPPETDETKQEKAADDEEKKEQVVEEEEEEDPSVVKYDGKYKELITQMEAKQDVLQQIILKINDLSEDLVPKKPEEKQEESDADGKGMEGANAEENKQNADTEDALLQRLVSKLEPNLQTQIQQMQQLLQMQQTTVMAMLAAGGSGGGGGGAIAMAGADAMLGAALGTPVPRISFHGLSGQHPQQLIQSQTDAAVESKEEEKSAVADRSSEYKEWFGSSKLIEDDEYGTLLGFFPDKGAKVKSMERVYRGSEEDFDAYKFHEKCDDVGPTLVIIQSEYSHVFGGFTTKGWKDESPNKSGTWKEDSDAFIYILRHPKDDILPERWKILPDKKEKTIRCDSNYGPVFGYGYDIRISTECDQKKDSSSQLDNEDACFGAPQDDDFLTGEFYFLVKEYEVYKVNM